MQNSTTKPNWDNQQPALFLHEGRRDTQVVLSSPQEQDWQRDTGDNQEETLKMANWKQEVKY